MAGHIDGGLPRNPNPVKGLHCQAGCICIVVAGRWQSRTGSALAMRFPFRDILFTYVSLYTSTPLLFPSPSLPSALLFLLLWIDFFIPFTHSDPLAALFAAEKRIRSFSETRAGRLTLPLQLVCDSISTYHSPLVFLLSSIWLFLFQ